MNTKYFNDDMQQLDPKNINAIHMPVLFLLDTSYSMDGEPIRKLQKSINRFKKDVCKNPQAADIVDICIMGFNGSPYMIQEWRPIGDMSPVELSAEGGTNITAAIEGAISKMRERTDVYADEGIELRVPWVIMLSDGYGGDVTDIAATIKQRTSEKKVKFWMLGIGGYDKETAAKLTEGKRILELADDAGYDFTDFFDFMSTSIKTVSTSAPGAKVHIDDPTEKPNSTLKHADLDAWLND